MIEYDRNAVWKTLDQYPELTEALREDLEYLVTQYKNSKQRKYLIDVTIFNILRKTIEAQFTADGKMNTNDQPF